MKKTFNFPALVAAIALTAIISASVFHVAPARAVSDEKLDNIRDNCSFIKQSLKRLQNSDKNTRVALGHSYQTILTNFITPLNVRLVKNNSFNSTLADSQTNFVLARDDFNQKYFDYSKDLESLIGSNCQSDPEIFYEKLAETRKKRALVATSTKNLRDALDAHIKEVEKL